METVEVNKTYICTQLQLHSQTLKEFGVRQIGLFGSYARNEATQDSDIDFLVDFTKEKKSLHNLVYLGDFLEKLFKKRLTLLLLRG